VQYNTEQPGEFFYLAEVMQAGRQMALATPGCGAAFGGDVRDCKAVEQGVARLFSMHSSPDLSPEITSSGASPDAKGRDTAQGRALSAAEARDQCGRLAVSYLVATRWDAVWSDPRAWVWTLPAVSDTGEVRVLDCAAPTR